jgi:hypothetical protein
MDNFPHWKQRIAKVGVHVGTLRGRWGNYIVRGKNSGKLMGILSHIKNPRPYPIEVYKLKGEELIIHPEATEAEIALMLSQIEYTSYCLEESAT